MTHDVGERISWTLRPPVSTTKENWETKRREHEGRLHACHGQALRGRPLRQFDGVVHLYNEKFAKPAAEIMKLVQKKKLGDGTAELRQQDRVDLLGDLAPRGPARPPRRRHDGSGLHLVARHLRGGPALLLQVPARRRRIDDPDVNA